MRQVTGGCRPVIRVGVVGYIASGEDQGSYVRIQELPDDPPSFLILMARDPETRAGGGDYWVEDRASLERFFAESRWVVEWRDV